LDVLREEMNKELNNLNKSKINQMTDPSRSQNENELYYQKLYQELQKQSEQTMLEYQQRLQEQQAMFDEERALLIESKMQLLNSVSHELQNMRDLIRAYNPDYRYKGIIDKVVRYNFPEGDGDTLFQLVHDAGLTDLEFQNRNNFKQQIESHKKKKKKNNDDKKMKTRIATVK